MMEQIKIIQTEINTLKAKIKSLTEEMRIKNSYLTTFASFSLDYQATSAAKINKFQSEQDVPRIKLEINNLQSEIITKELLIQGIRQNLEKKRLEAEWQFSTSTSSSSNFSAQSSAIWPTNFDQPVLNTANSLFDESIAYDLTDNLAQLQRQNNLYQSQIELTNLVNLAKTKLLIAQQNSLDDLLTNQAKIARSSDSPSQLAEEMNNFLATGNLYSLWSSLSSEEIEAICQKQIEVTELEILYEENQSAAQIQAPPK